MNYEELEKILLEKPGAWLDYPFGEGAAVFKVGSKMFALARWNEDPLEINLKCDPDDAIVLREMFSAVKPGYHMNKRHWNTVTLDETVPEHMFLEMIEISYKLVFKSLKKAEREEILNS
ncbi:MAG: MmcQ/YjbR family DNA-binding protein [Chloroflexota bacterium]